MINSKLSHHSLAVPYFLAMIASTMTMRASQRPPKATSQRRRSARGSRTQMQKASRRRNRRG